MKNYILLFFLLIGINCQSQKVYYGLPVNNFNISSGDIIITNLFQWEISYNNLSSIGKIQLDELTSFITYYNSYYIEIYVNVFYSSNKEFNQKLSDNISQEIKDNVFKKDSLLNNYVKIISCGSSDPFVKNDSLNWIYYSNFNNRIMIKIKEKRE